ncbi:hypothetical protein EON63_15765 [archaeon]|nr:MAG: hypothetical protein EON63_15765 [archaeon]
MVYEMTAYYTNLYVFMYLYTLTFHTLQEKVIVTSMHYTDDAESIHIHIPIPTDICPSTQTLLFEVCVYIYICTHVYA